MDFSSINYIHPDEIPLNATICLYGTGQGGEESYKLLKSMRPDVKVAAFADTFKTGKFLERPILTPQELAEQQDNFALTIVCSLYFLEIQKVLNTNNIKKFGFFAWPKFFKYVFFPKDLSSVQDKINKISSKLETEDDRRLFGDLCDARSINSTLTYIKTSDDGIPSIIFKDHHNLKSLYPENTAVSYFDFIDLSIVEYAVQGGVYDGGEAVFMIENCPKLIKLFGFEPLGSSSLDISNSKKLDDSKKFQLIEKGLWNSSKQVTFIANGSASCVNSNVSNDGKDKINLCSLNDEAQNISLKKLDFLFCDIENAEIPMLEGAIDLIVASRTQLAICFYHSKKQFIDTPLMLMDHLEDYVFKIGHYSLSSDESVFYAIPREKYSGYQTYS
ncbi:FkbM family methyltransferase [Maridesulfovibrio frigidus]|uniref:FkbM family methyltransferase n=1 Tax=Maridesulfovibrio frigidus TaxID=340956 RepID=UPI0004E1030F|nr:FkbM family methyltransferase [Maridesulfovibrio frigidus]